MKATGRSSPTAPASGATIPTAARRQVEGGPIDYLVMDFLAEVTMAILQKQRARKPETGYHGGFSCCSCATFFPPASIAASASSPTPAASTRSAAAPRWRRWRKSWAWPIGSRWPWCSATISIPISTRCWPSGEPLTNMDTGKPLADIRAARAVRQRVHRRGRPREGAGARRERDHRGPRGGRRGDACADDARVRMVAHGLGPHCRRRDRGAHHRMRRAVHRGKFHRLAAGEELPATWAFRSSKRSRTAASW